MLQRFGAACFESCASSLSPPDHLLYQMLKIVPVCGGGSDLIVLGSTCGRAGRRFRRMSLVFLAGGSPFSETPREVSLLVIVKPVFEGSVAGWGSSSGEAERFRDGGEEGWVKVVRAWTTSAMPASRQGSKSGRLGEQSLEQNQGALEMSKVEVLRNFRAL
jgi:hypothetical protein